MKSSNLRMISILTVGVIALGGRSGSAPSDTEGKQDAEKVTLTMSISLWNPKGYCLPELQKLIHEYGEEKNIYIGFVNYFEKYGEGASQKLSVELMSGRGPDILVNPGLCLHSVDIHKIMASGVFEDLGPLLDLESKRNRYFTKVLDSEKYEDEQLIVPLFFSIAVSRNSGHIEEAAEFTEYLLSGIVQCTYFDLYMPVYRQGVKARIEAYWREEDMPAYLYDNYCSIANDAGECSLIIGSPQTCTS